MITDEDKGAVTLDLQRAKFPPSSIHTNANAGDQKRSKVQVWSILTCEFVSREDVTLQKIRDLGITDSSGVAPCSFMPFYTTLKALKITINREVSWIAMSLLTGTDGIF